MADDFTDWIDLASERVGGAVLFANDEFFAEKENLLRPHAPEWREGVYTDRGKWMDGWETRRRRDGGTSDHCVIRLGLPGIVRGVVVDTRFFRGNFPSECSIEAAELSTHDDLAAARSASTKWTEILPRSALQGDTVNRFDVHGAARTTHLRFTIHPDGGVARLRVHGEVVPDWARLRARGSLVDLAAAENGGRVPVCSDMFFGSRHHLILPGTAANMGEGWETRRRRGPGHDWTIVALGARGTVREAEIDTTHFKGNAPGKASLDGCDAAGASVKVLTSGRVAWRPLLPARAMQPHTRHRFADELRAIGSVTHVRLNVFPDGGVARMRLFGEPAAEEASQFGIDRLNALPRHDAIASLLACCGSTAWAERVADRRPIEDLPALLRIAERVWWSLRQADWRDAFAAHPAIGGRHAKRKKDGRASRWSSQEQRSVAAAPAKTLARLARLNREYRAKQGFVFLVCASGKSPGEMLEMLEARLANDPDLELRTAAEEQMAITRLRLRRWCAEEAARAARRRP